MSLSFHRLVIDANLTHQGPQTENYDQSSLTTDYSDVWRPKWSAANKGFALDPFQPGMRFTNGKLTIISSFDVPMTRKVMLDDFATFDPFGFRVYPGSPQIFVESQCADTKHGVLEGTYKFVDQDSGNAQVCQASLRLSSAPDESHTALQRLTLDTNRTDNILLFRSAFCQHNIYDVTYLNGLEYGEEPSHILTGVGTLADRHKTRVAFASTYRALDGDEKEVSFTPRGISRADHGAACHEAFLLSPDVIHMDIVTVMISERDMEDPVRTARDMVRQQDWKRSRKLHEDHWRLYVWGKGSIAPITNGKANITAALHAALYDLWTVAGLHDLRDMNSDTLNEFVLPVYILIHPRMARKLCHEIHTQKRRVDSRFAVNIWNLFRMTNDRNWLQDFGFAILREVANRIVDAYDADASPHNEAGARAAYLHYLDKLVLRYAIEACYLLQAHVFYRWQSLYDTLPVTQFSNKQEGVLLKGDVYNLLPVLPYWSEELVSSLQTKWNVGQREQIVQKNLDAQSNAPVDNMKLRAIKLATQGILGKMSLTNLQSLEQTQGIWRRFRNIETSAIYVWTFVQGMAQLRASGKIDPSGFAVQSLGLGYVPKASLPSWQGLKVLTENRSLVVENQA